MPQYSYYIKEVPKYWVNPVTGLRTRCWIHNNYWQVDYELTPLGFNGVEDIDWHTGETDGTLVSGNKAREGVRNQYYVVDVELVPNGFILSEDVGWRNIISKT